ncbi:MAG: HDOD domain-containing protein [Planctomycetota bacterium]
MEPTQSRVLKDLRIPSFRENTHRILRLTGDSSANSKDFARLIVVDPGLSTQVLKLVNSALYALRRRVTSIPEACVLLGLRNLRSLCLAGALADELAEGTRREISACWEYSLLTGGVAQHLAQVICPEAEADVSAAGLLHAVGLIALLGTERVGYEAIIEAAQARAVDWSVVEREQLRTDHAEVAEAIGRRWKLRDEVCELLGGWERLCSGAGTPGLCLAVASAWVQIQRPSFQHFANPTGRLAMLRGDYAGEMAVVESQLEPALERASLQLEILRR